MILKNHIVYRFLTDTSMHMEVAETMYPESMVKFNEYCRTVKDDDIITVKDFPIEVESIGTFLIFLDAARGNLNYWITDSVNDKLSMLKVKRQNNGYFDWSVFSHIPNCKKTFIFPNNTFMRLNIERDVIHFMFCRFTYDKSLGNKLDGTMEWDLFFADRYSGIQTSDFNYEKVCKVDEHIYRLMCFFFLTENDEVVVPAGGKNGTRKDGKIVNSLNVPIIIVNSRWNTTVIRTEGFPVSGHFRIQPCGPQMSQHKLIFINPFTKNGYIRKAPSKD